MKINKKILIISRADERLTHDTQFTMVNEFSKLGDHAGEYIGANLEDLLFVFDVATLSITDSVSKMDICEFDLIFMIGWFKTKTLEDVASSVAKYAKSKNIPFFNTEALNSRVRSKLTQYVIAGLNDIAMTPFRFAMNQHALLRSIQESPFDEQFVVKGVAASRGDDNYLLQSADDFKKILADVDPTREVHFIAQQFVPNEGDYRVLVVGDEVRLVIHRQSQTESHLNNTSQGGEAHIIPLSELPKAMLDDSVKIAKLVNREITGIDMIVHKQTGHHFLLEANNMPQLSTGAFISDKIQMLDSYFNEILSR